MAALTPTAKMQFFKADGTPLVGGKLYTYTAGTTTPQTTYTDSSGGTANTNPIILDSRGEANIWLGGSTYKFKLADANDVEIWTVDNISAPTSGVSPALSGNVTIDTNSSSPALKITQTGTGYALRVQDSTDPDATSTVIDNTGKIGIGTISPSELLDVSGGNLVFTSSGGTAYAKITPGASDTTISAEGARTLTLSANSVTGASISTSGVLTASVSLSTDTINEKTSTAGVTIDGVLIKDSLIGAQYRPITVATTQATSGSSPVDFNDIPSWVRRITVVFDSVSVDITTTGVTVQLGTGTSGSPAFVTSGYTGTSAQLPNGAAIVATNISSGFYSTIAVAAYALSGLMTITRQGSSNLYAASWAFGTNSAASIVGGGVVTLGAVATQLRIDPVGVANFDAGSVNIFYE